MNDVFDKFKTLQHSRLKRDPRPSVSEPDYCQSSGSDEDLHESHTTYFP